MSNPKDSGRVVVPKPCNCILPYRVYMALITQEGTDAPVATVLQNTLGFDLTWGYSLGAYSATPSVVTTFDPTKTVLTVGNSNNTSFSEYNIKKELKLHFTNLQFVLNTGIITADTGTGVFIDTAANDLLYRTPVEIRLYP